MSVFCFFLAYAAWFLKPTQVGCLPGSVGRACDSVWVIKATQIKKEMTKKRGESARATRNLVTILHPIIVMLREYSSCLFTK